jgi:hypothetical protein
MTANDFAFATQHDDNDSMAHHDLHDQRLRPGRDTVQGASCRKRLITSLPRASSSADNVAIDWLNLIPQCVGTGQAAGVRPQSQFKTA